MKTFAVRWSGDEDFYFGPFTYSWSKYRPFCIMLSSWGGGDDDDDPCQLRLSWFWGTLIVRLPPIVQPWREKVYPDPKNWGPEVVERLGRNWYWNVDVRSYGINICGSGTVGDSSFLTLHYGRNGGSCMDSSIQQQWGCFLPWTEWRHVRRSFYGLNGQHFATAPEGVSYKLGGNDAYARESELEVETPKRRYRFRDFDGEEPIATTHIEEREWRAGTGWFKWLERFRRPIIYRSLCIEFSGGTGKCKGSWKGGIIGASIEMSDSRELHLGAFLRYCHKGGMKFVDVA